MSAKKSKAARRSTARVEVVRQVTPPPKRWPLLTIRWLAAFGLAVSAYLSILHYQAGASGTINSPLCSVGTAINCNEVLGSTYARLFGVPVAFWATATYAVVLFLSFVGQTSLLVLLCGWMFAFSVYMAGLSLAVIKSVCLFCLSLYAVNTGLLIAAIALTRSSALVAGRQVAYSLAGYAILLVGFGWWQSQAVAKAVAPTPITAHAPGQIDKEYERYYNGRPLVTLTGAERHTKGSVQATVTISEFVDFRCPTCARAREVLKQVLDSNPNDVRIVFRHYPLDRDCNPTLPQQVHPTACVAAFAAECAGEQGKFWEYADLLFVDQKVYTRQDLETYAGALSLDIDRFNSCLDEGRTKIRIQTDIEEAAKVGIKATPTLVINGHLIEGLPTPDQFAALLAIEKRQTAKQ
jgi:protein-disulfide isomerase